MSLDDWEIEDYLDRKEKIEDLNDEVVTSFQTKVYEKTWLQLHEYQREGCKWMYQLYQSGVGGILSDEMGKSSLIIAFASYCYIIIKS